MTSRSTAFYLLTASLVILTGLGVARGQYNAEVYLFRNGTVEAAQSSPLFIDQIGMERRVFNLAHQWPLFYGLAAVLMAAFLGWLSSVLFRRPI